MRAPAPCHASSIKSRSPPNPLDVAMACARSYIRPDMKKLERIGRARAAVRYFRDPSASLFGKLFVFAALAYVVIPLDLIPDVPIVGWLDDMGVMSLAIAWMWRVIGRYRDGEFAPSPLGRTRE